MLFLLSGVGGHVSGDGAARPARHSGRPRRTARGLKQYSTHRNYPDGHEMVVLKWSSANDPGYQVKLVFITCLLQWGIFFWNNQELEDLWKRKSRERAEF